MKEDDAEIDELQIQRDSLNEEVNADDPAEKVDELAKNEGPHAPQNLIEIANPNLLIKKRKDLVPVKHNNR